MLSQAYATQYRDADDDVAAIIPRGDRALNLRAAEYAYGLPIYRLRVMIAKNEIDIFKIGRSVFVSENSLIQYMERHRQSAVGV